MIEKRTEDAAVDVYGDRFSGNCYKVSLLLDLAGKAYRWHDIDILKGESRTPEFLALNPNGRVPAVKLADGRTMAESNAILYLLAIDTPWWPATDYERADVLRSSGADGPRSLPDPRPVELPVDKGEDDEEDRP